LNPDGGPSLAFYGLEDAILQTYGHIAQADVVGLFLEPDQWLAIEAHFEAITQVRAEGGLDGEPLFGGVVVRQRLLEPEFDLECSHGDGLRAVTDVGPIGLHGQGDVVSRPAQGRHDLAADQQCRPHPSVSGVYRWPVVTQGHRKMKRRVRVRTWKFRLMPVMLVPPRTARRCWPAVGVEAARGLPDPCAGNRHPPLSRLYPASGLPASLFADNDGLGQD
jgi:hypothetical protein